MTDLTDLTEAADIEVDEGAIRSFFSSLSLAKLVPAVLTLLVCIAITKLVLRSLDKMLARSHIEKSLHGFLRTLTKIGLYALTVIVFAGQLGIEVTSLVAVFSIAALAVSLALQGALSNLAGGIVILSSHPFKVDDFVAVGDVSGTVQEIGLTYTKLTTIDNKLIFIPNSEITASTLVNYTAMDTRRVDITVSASYGCALADVKASLFHSASVIDQILPDPACQVYVSSYEESCIQYVLRAWVNTPDYWPAYYALLEQIKQDFDDRGLEMTYPHLNVHVEQK